MMPESDMWDQELLDNLAEIRHQYYGICGAGNLSLEERIKLAEEARARCDTASFQFSQNIGKMKREITRRKKENRDA